MNLSEKLRPRTLADVIGQKSAVSEIERLIKRNGPAGQCIWLAGESGTGKTSIAEILADDWDTQRAPSQSFVGRAMGVDDAERIRDTAGQPRFFGDIRVWIVNEAQDLSKDVIKILLDAVERIGASKTDAIIFTSMIDLAEFCGASIHHQALFDRFICPTMARTDSAEFREAVENYVEEIAAELGRHCPDVRGHCQKVGYRIRAAVNSLDLLPDVGETTDRQKEDAPESIAETTEPPEADPRPRGPRYRHKIGGLIGEKIGNYIYVGDTRYYITPNWQKWI